MKKKAGGTYSLWNSNALSGSVAARLWLAEQEAMDIGDDATVCDHGWCENFVKFFIVANCKLKMSRGDCLLLILSTCVAGELKDFNCQVFEDGRRVDTSTNADFLCVASLSDFSGDASNGEHKVTSGGGWASFDSWSSASGCHLIFCLKDLKL